MKRFILLAAVMIWAIQPFAQSSERLPGKIKKALMEKYPDAEIVKVQGDWQMKGMSKQDKLWNILFKHGEKLSSARYDNKANWLMTKTKIAEQELPEAVMKTIDEYYYMYQIVIAATFEKPGSGGYEVFLDNGNDGFDIQFSQDGEVLSREITSQGYRPIDDDGNFVD